MDDVGSVNLCSYDNGDGVALDGLNLLYELAFMSEYDF
jgi:hypothetical protein